MQIMNRLYRPRNNRMLAGVAAGLAYRFGLPVWLVRLGWLLLFLPGGLPGIIPYAILWIVMPSE
jgi:phage shock protein PspC (stress-responsive transcriptional regulator)